MIAISIIVVLISDGDLLGLSHVVKSSRVVV